ncbi:hypothetical protein L1049_014421 [Liquidambar formosana]|uniref:Uncharacterized protein n=1 Tax=Liquidambar formosana TaxID=63359 RepID=A0AAP0X0D7_LIQFO
MLHRGESKWRSGDDNMAKNPCPHHLTSPCFPAIKVRGENPGDDERCEQRQLEPEPEMECTPENHSRSFGSGGEDHLVQLLMVGLGSECAGRMCLRRRRYGEFETDRKEKAGERKY